MKVAIIGSGFAGLCMGIKLKQAGINDFTIFEKDEGLGGTWRVNKYPGCECDIESHLYSYSFDLNPDWSKTFGSQKEIRDYMERCADKFNIRQHIKFNSPLEKAVYNEEEKHWELTILGGQKTTSQFLITGTGGLSIPAFPDIKGLSEYEGKTMHSAEWDTNYEINSKRIAVIGTGASAIQIVPNIADDVNELMLFQRTPPWVIPKPNKTFKSYHKWMFRNIPGLMRFYRNFLYWLHEMSATGFVVNPSIMKLPQWLTKRNIRKTINDANLAEKLIPNYRFGCKRVLLSNEYYPTLNKENVNVVTNGIDHVTKDSIVTKDGASYQIDTIIYATGFQATEYLSTIKVVGLGGKELRDISAEVPEAYLGTTAVGFPNLFMLTGPNTGLGHSSMVFMIESQVAYIIDCFKKMDKQNLSSIEIKPKAIKTYNDDLQKKIKNTVWQTGGCKSWYMDPKTGKNVTLWPGYTFTFRLKTRKFDEENYIKT